MERGNGIRRQRIYYILCLLIPFLIFSVFLFHFLFPCFLCSSVSCVARFFILHHPHSSPMSLIFCLILKHFFFCVFFYAFSVNSFLPFVPFLLIFFSRLL